MITNTDTALKHQRSLGLLLASLMVVFLVSVTAFVGYSLGTNTAPTKSISPEAMTPAPQVSGVEEVLPPPDALSTACPMDVKLCPDGSSVGRSGPECTFEPCPNEVSNLDGYDPQVLEEVLPGEVAGAATEEDESTEESDMSREFEYLY